MSLFRTSSFPHRILTAVCATLVLALSVFAASPAAHEWLHPGDNSHACRDHAKPAPAASPDHLCAVVLFAQGVEGWVSPVTVVPPVEAGASDLALVGDEFFWVAPRFLRPPERGPPAGLNV